MKFLNLGAGDSRCHDPRWTNIDNLAETLDPSIGRHKAVLEQIKNEADYFHLDMRQRTWPWEDNCIDAIASHHCFEHFDAIDLQRILSECYRILKPNGVLRCSVPDASYFRRVHQFDDRPNAFQFFGETIHHPEYHTFCGWALFLYEDHRQVFTEDSLWCTLVNRECPRNGSFDPQDVMRAPFMATNRPDHYCANDAAQIDRRPLFSLIMEAFKQVQ